MGLHTTQKKVEMIIEYTTDGKNYRYSDNRGVLIRCGNCRFYHDLLFCCDQSSGEWWPKDFCSKGEPKDD